MKKMKNSRPSAETAAAISRAVADARSEGRPLRLLFVCLGNICRSPAAQGIVEQMAREKGLGDMVECDSAGFYGGHRGDLPDYRMREAAWARGYRLEHRSRTVRPSDFDYYDLIFGMDENNLASLRSAAPTIEAESKILPMADLAQDHPDDFYVPDPYYSGRLGFILVLDLLEDAASTLLSYL